MGLIDNAGFRNTLFSKDLLKNKVLKRNQLCLNASQKIKKMIKNS